MFKFKYIYRAVMAVSLLMFAHSFYFWGGIGLTPNVGDRVLMQASKQLDLIGIAFYTHTGKAMMGLVAPDAAQTYAATQVGHVYPSLDGDKFTAAHKVHGAMNSTQRLSHMGAPLGLLAFIALYYLRPKPVRSLGR
jgi:hypothetical protein